MPARYVSSLHLNRQGQAMPHYHQSSISIVPSSSRSVSTSALLAPAPRVPVVFKDIGTVVSAHHCNSMRVVVTVVWGRVPADRNCSL